MEISYTMNKNDKQKVKTQPSTDTNSSIIEKGYNKKEKAAVMKKKELIQRMF